MLTLLLSKFYPNKWDLKEGKLYWERRQNQVLSEQVGFKGNIQRFQAGRLIVLSEQVGFKGIDKNKVNVNIYKFYPNKWDLKLIAWVEYRLNINSFIRTSGI